MSTQEMVFMYIIGPLIAIIASYVTYLMGRKKTTAEVKTNELDNTEKAITIWRTLAEDFSSQLQSRDSQLAELKAQLEKVFQQNNELLKDMTILKKDYGQLLTNYNALKKSIEQ